jgi:3-oxo-5alpha-steroid 4-dehydrogenase
VDTFPDKQGLSRRQLLAAGAGTAAMAVTGAEAAPAAQVKSWDIITDVLVAGSGSAGISAAIEARQTGAEVLVIESLARPGGSSAMSGGVIYAGGGTALQKSLGVEDSVEGMYRFISEAGGPHPQLDKIQVYCEESVAHFDWLVAQGIPYGQKFTAAKGLPMGDESLYYSGTELAWPARELALPAPRGHVPGVPGMNGGRRLMESLLQRSNQLRVALQTLVAGERLIVESDGRVVGMQVRAGDQTLRIRARRGVVLASGGFIHNRQMLKLYAPQLYDCSVPWGNAGDLGVGIRMGMSVGAAALRMHEGFAIAPIYPPENTISGVLVNASGQRFIGEDAYHGVLGDAIAYHQQGKAWLITDASSSFSFEQDNFPRVASAPAVGDLASRLPLPRGALQHTVAYYNRHAINGEDPMFRKSSNYLQPLQKPPFTAWDLSVEKAFFPVHTFGGLHTNTRGAVLNSFGEEIAGLFAAGRTTAGLPIAPYLASGLSVGDCTFFGRRAGSAAAQEKSA